MYKVLLFGGTVEGRTVAEYLNENKIPSMVCVATEYGESLLPQGEYLELSHERLDEKRMRSEADGREDVTDGERAGHRCDPSVCPGSDGKY